jgi:putative endonuclease
MPAANPQLRFDEREREGSHWPSLDGAAPFLDNPVIARSPCDEAIQGRCALRGVSLRGLPRTRFRTILSALADRRPEFPMPRIPCVYIMANDRNGTLCTGVTSNLPQRIHQHREGLGEGFMRRYRRKLLAFYETYERIDEAIAREKQIKGGSRARKMALIEAMNPQWRDLYADFA